MLDSISGMSIVYKKSLCWIRRDLRLHDNKALYEAILRSESVLICFVFDTKILNLLDDKKDLRVTFIYQSLKELDRQLKKKDSRLFVMYGDPTYQVPQLCQTLNLSAVFVNEDYESYSKKRDTIVKHKLSQIPVDFYSFKDHVIFNGSEIKKKDGTPYRVFTPYKKAWLKRLQKKDIKPYKIRLNKLLKQNEFQQYLSSWNLKKIGFHLSALPYPAGVSAAQSVLKKFTKKIHSYHKTRDFPSLEGTSQLSTHLRFGTVSIRKCITLSLKSKNKGHQTWLSELIWREFYQMILDQFPYVEKKAFLKKYQNIKWPYSQKRFQAWCKGQTGYPIVDAAIRQLNQTGYMPNRLRMLTASFLVKHLLIDWRKGEAYFEKKLLDFDKAANNGGWQWCAGTGCDAQPYFRIFNPITQSKKFDPKGLYIKKWIPELEFLNEKHIHFPQEWKKELPKTFKIGKHYPAPIVRHNIQRQKAIDLFLKYK